MCFDGENIPLGAFLKSFFKNVLGFFGFLLLFFFNPGVENPLSEDGAI